MTSLTNEPSKKRKAPKEKPPPRPWRERRADQVRKHAGSQETVRYIDEMSFDEQIPRDPDSIFPTNTKEHEEIKKKRSSSRQRVRLGNSYIPSPAISNRFDVYAKPLGKVIAEGPQNNIHDMYLWLTAYMCRLGFPVEALPEFIGMVCNHAGSRSPALNVEGAIRTVRRWLDRDECVGGKRLREQFPHIYEEATRIFTLMHVHADHFDTEGPAETPKLVSFAEAQARVTDIVSDKESTGTTLIIVSPGAGKTFAAVEAAARAGDNMNVGIATDTNALAKQVTREFERKGRHVGRIFGVTAFQGDGECAYKPSAVSIAGSGQSVFAVLCKGMGRVECDRFHTCKAKDRFEGDADSRILVGPHAKLPEIIEHVGETGKLIIDESKSQVSTQTITLEDLLHTQQYAENFASSYTKRMTPLLDAFIAWTSTVGEGSADFNAIPTACVDALDHDALLTACFDAAIDPNEDMAKTVKSLALAAIDPDKPSSPPIKTRVIARIRQQTVFAQAIARASSVYSALYNAAARPDLTEVHVDENDVGRFATLMFVDPIYKRAVNRPNGRTILLDATGETQVHILKQVCPDVKIEKIDLEDACEVDREIHFTKGFRRQWFSKGKKIAWNGPLKFAFEHVRDVIAEERLADRGKNVCLVTHKPIRVAIQIAMNVISSDMPDPRAVWRAMGYTDFDLAMAIREVRKYLSSDTQFVLFHYGAERGRNDAIHCDTIITIGDPRPNVDQIRREANLVGSDTETRGKNIAAAILTQSLERTRQLSPFRTAGRLRAVHIGSIRPSEPQWGMLDKVRMTFAPLDEDARATMTNEEFAALFWACGKSMGEVALLLGVHRNTVSKWLTGKASITAADDESIRAVLVTQIVPEASEAPEAPDIPSTNAVA